MTNYEDRKIGKFTNITTYRAESEDEALDIAPRKFPELGVAKPMHN